MSQMTIYLPDKLEQEVRRRAKEARRSVSSYLAGLLNRELHPPSWPEEFRNLYGSVPDFPEIPDLEPEPMEEPS